jgi:hypothetical protein
MLLISFGCTLLMYSKVINTTPNSLTLKTTTMSFTSAAIHSIANNRSLGHRYRKGLQVTGLPIAKVTGEILEPASALVVKRFQQKLARERKQEQLILVAVMTTSLFISIGLVLLLLGII